MFCNMTVDLAEWLADQKIDYVVGDALEGYNPIHDVTRMMLNTAIAMTRRRKGLAIQNFRFSLIENPANDRSSASQPEIKLTLSEAEFEIKKKAINDYHQLKLESSQAISKFGINAFRTERFEAETAAHSGRNMISPYYERYGEQCVESGKYKHVLRQKEHLNPLYESLDELMTQSAFVT